MLGPRRRVAGCHNVQPGPPARSRTKDAAQGSSRRPEGHQMGTRRVADEDLGGVAPPKEGMLLAVCCHHAHHLQYRGGALWQPGC